MKQCLRPTDTEIQSHMDLYGEAFFMLKDLNDGYYRIVLVDPETVRRGSEMQEMKHGK